MKNLEEYLLEKIAEECGELTQVAMKASEFGLDDTNPKENKINLELLVKEANDVKAHVDMLHEYITKFQCLPYPNKPHKEWKKLWSSFECALKQNKASFYALRASDKLSKLHLDPWDREFIENKADKHRTILEGRVKE